MEDKKFWPFVAQLVKDNKLLPRVVNAARDDVAKRMPNCPLLPTTEKILTLAGVPVPRIFTEAFAAAFEDGDAKADGAGGSGAVLVAESVAGKRKASEAASPTAGSAAAAAASPAATGAPAATAAATRRERRVVRKPGDNNDKETSKARTDCRSI